MAERDRVDAENRKQREEYEKTARRVREEIRQAKEEGWLTKRWLGVAPQRRKLLLLARELIEHGAASRSGEPVMPGALRGFTLALAGAALVVGIEAAGLVAPGDFQLELGGSGCVSSILRSATSSFLSARVVLSVANSPVATAQSQTAMPRSS